MDLIAYLFACLQAIWPLLALALAAWVINACRNPIKSSRIYTPTREQQAAADRKLRATIDLTSTADFGVNVRRSHENHEWTEAIQANHRLHSQFDDTTRGQP